MHAPQRISGQISFASEVSRTIGFSYISCARDWISVRVSGVGDSVAEQLLPGEIRPSNLQWSVVGRPRLPIDPVRRAWAVGGRARPHRRSHTCRRGNGCGARQQCVRMSERIARNL
jgi:hypothetical protein